MIHSTDLLMTRRARERLFHAGVAPEQNLVILLLAEHQPLSQVEIAENLGKDKTNITKVLAVLEQRELVVRTASDVDRRTVLVALTEKGCRLAGLTAPIAEAFQSEVIGGLDPEVVAAFLATLEVIRQNVTDGEVGK